MAATNDPTGTGWRESPWTKDRHPSQMSSAVKTVLVVCAAALVGVLLVLHNANMRAYNRCVGNVQYAAHQQVQAEVAAGRFTGIPDADTSVCHRTWP